MGNEKKMSQDDVLKNIVSDLKTLKESVGKTVKSDDLKTIVSAIIKDVLKEHKSEIENLLEEKNQSLIKIIETQKCEIEGLKTQVGELAAENENLQGPERRRQVAVGRVEMVKCGISGHPVKEWESGG